MTRLQATDSRRGFFWTLCDGQVGCHLVWAQGKEVGLGKAVGRCRGGGRA